MPVTLEGSCRCGAVTFTVASHTPYPYQRCYCSICRKAGAGGGFAVNIMGDATALKIGGEGHLGTFVAVIDDGGGGDARQGTCQRRFCRNCATMLWVYDDGWPDLVHPFVSAIDSDLPEPPERVHLMLASKAAWVVPQIGPKDQSFDEYPDQSIEDWHKSRGLWIA